MMKITINGKDVELLKDVPEYYCYISEMSNQLLDMARDGMKTWVSEEVWNNMNVSLWIYTEEQVNAFVKQQDGNNYIALSVGLLQEFYEVTKEFIEQDKLNLVFNISEERKDSYRRVLFLFMMHFVIAHEFAHILHGHLRYGRDEKIIHEIINNAEVENLELNWITQLKEYDADSFAAHNLAIKMLNDWSDNIEYLREWFDLLCMTIYLCFCVFARNSKRNFDNYFQRDIMQYDHPYPGIRMYYTVVAMMDMICSNKEMNDDLYRIFSSGYDTIISYEKKVLGTPKLKECYFSISSTEKGVQHMMNLVNGWNDKIDEYNKYAYIPLSKNEYIKQMSFFLDEKGEFLS